MNDLIPFDELQTHVAIGFGIFAGAIALAAAMAYIKTVHWSCAGVWAMAMMFWASTLSAFVLTALWTFFAGAAVGMTIHCFKDLTEKRGGCQRRAVLPTALRGLALLCYPITFLASFETSIGGAAPAFLLGALLLALIGCAYWLHQRAIRLGLMEVREAYSASAILALLSLFNIARLYLAGGASPLLAKIMLWMALPAACITLAVAFDRMEKRAKRAAQTPTGA